MNKMKTKKMMRILDESTLPIVRIVFTEMSTEDEEDKKKTGRRKEETDWNDIFFTENEENEEERKSISSAFLLLPVHIFYFIFISNSFFVLASCSLRMFDTPSTQYEDLTRSTLIFHINYFV